MPLENLFADEGQGLQQDPRKEMFQRFGVVSNPFPNAAQTSGHPHLAADTDRQVDADVAAFVTDAKSQALAVTASQGIGKTNLLNAYESALNDKLTGRGFYVIRYMADPDPSFDHLLRAIFEQLGEDHLQRLASTATGHNESERVAALLDEVRVNDVRNMLERLIRAKRESAEDFDELVALAHQWLLGLRVLKAHREQLGVYYRLDTVESKTRALREVAVFSAELGELRGIFLLLDELEKQGSSLSKTMVLRYLSALRALIDALPKYLFLMVALTTDALERYREMLPALKGRLANEVRLHPIRSEDEAVKYWRFYLDIAREEGEAEARRNGWGQAGQQDIVSQSQAIETFRELRKSSTVEGVRQRDFLNELSKLASGQ